MMRELLQSVTCSIFAADQSSWSTPILLEISMIEYKNRVTGVNVISVGS